MRSFTIGKLRGLQQIANNAGIFAMCAMDHRGSMQRMISPQNPGAVSYETLVAYSIGHGDEDPSEFARRKPGVVVRQPGN